MSRRSSFLGFTGRNPQRHRNRLVHPQRRSGRAGRRLGGKLVFLRRADTGGEGPVTVYPNKKKMLLLKFSNIQEKRMEYIAFFNN